MIALHLDDVAYPAQLHALKRTPETLYVRGRLEPEAPAVGIVGARRATEHGRRLAWSLARDLAAEGVSVVSGGALGIDTAAHEGALDVGGHTVVVLPSSVDQPYPRRNARLFERVVEVGALVSEYGTPPGHKGAFLDRNRIIAALADVVVVVEASERSGTRHTVSAARELGRPVAAMPWTVGRLHGAGCVRLLCDGARAVAGAPDVLVLLGLKRSRPPTLDLTDVSPTQGRILKMLATSPATAEGVAQALSLPIESVLGALTRMEVLGRVTSRTGGRFAAVIRPAP